MLGRNGCGCGPTRSTQVSSKVTKASRRLVAWTGLPDPPTAASNCRPTSGRITPLTSVATVTPHFATSRSRRARARASAVGAERPRTRYWSFLPMKLAMPMPIACWQVS